MTEINKNQTPNSQNSDSKKNEKYCCFKKLKSCYQEFSPSKSFIAASCILLGIGATLLTQNFSQHRQKYLVIRDHFPFGQSIAFADDDFFEQMEEMQKEAERNFAAHQKRMREVFDDSRATNKSKVSSREDADNYFYQLDFYGFTKEEITVSVKDNVVNFSAENKKSDNEKNKEASARASFQYSFSVPDYDTKKEPEITQKDGQIIVKLAKKK